MKLDELAGVGIAFVVSGIILGIGADILTEVNADCTNQSAPIGDAAYCGHNIGNYSINSVAELSSWLPTIALVIAASLIIGIVVAYFVYKRE